MRSVSYMTSAQMPRVRSSAPRPRSVSSIWARTESGWKRLMDVTLHTGRADAAAVPALQDRTPPTRIAVIRFTALPQDGRGIMSLSSLAPQEIADRLALARTDYESFAAGGLDLDITRGKPSAAQLDLADPLLTAVGPGDARAADGTDTRNYGGLAGLPEIREIFAPLLSVP